MAGRSSTACASISMKYKSVFCFSSMQCRDQWGGGEVEQNMVMIINIISGGRHLGTLPSRMAVADHIHKS